MRSYRSLSAAVFAIVFCALLGGFYGRSALVAQDQIPDQYKVFTAALSAIESNFVGRVESDRLVYGAITGMLQTLDPHSSFMDPRSYAQMRERQEGRYYGLGISINVVDGDITVFSLFEGSPAYQKGLRRGDVIAGGSTRGAVGASSRAITSSRQASASSVRRARANARARPARSPDGADRRASGEAYPASSRAMTRASDRTSSSLWRTTAARGWAGPPRRNPR